MNAAVRTMSHEKQVALAAFTYASTIFLCGAQYNFYFVLRNAKFTAQCQQFLRQLHLQSGLEAPPRLQKLGVFCRARWGQAVVLPGGPAGDRALVLLREAVPAEAPEEGVDSALLGVGEAVVELPEELIAVLVSPAEALGVE